VREFTSLIGLAIRDRIAGTARFAMRVSTDMSTSASISVRKAVPADVPALRGLIDASVRGLQAQDYTPTQIESALATVFGVDSQLIEDGTYFVAEAKAPAIELKNRHGAGGGSVIAGCGGWSKRKTLYGSDHWTGREDELLDPRVDAAKIRAFFIHPGWARRGIGSLILKTCEDAAAASGFTRCEMGATLTGVRLFGAKGYVALENILVPLKNGEGLPVVRMSKQLR
jgi:GNAT superfamily N-acetyltransferase